MCGGDRMEPEEKIYPMNVLVPTKCIDCNMSMADCAQCSSLHEHCKVCPLRGDCSKREAYRTISRSMNGVAV